MVNAAGSIREALTAVAATRTQVQSDPALARTTMAIKQFQSARFARTYADLAAQALFAPAVEFFLGELYSAADYAGRDAQFARVAGAMQRMLPEDTLAVAVELARLHALSEALDLSMALAALALPGQGAQRTLDTRTYVLAWRQVGRAEDRRQQLAQVLALGRELTRMTRSRGLGLLLKMMHNPAHAAGFGDLHRFLETGFTTFAAMNRSPGASRAFLAAIGAREGLLIHATFERAIEEACSLLEAPGPALAAAGQAAGAARP